MHWTSRRPCLDDDAIAREQGCRQRVEDIVEWVVPRNNGADLRRTQGMSIIASPNRYHSSADGQGLTAHHAQRMVLNPRLLVEHLRMQPKWSQH